jgi:hypothetical protein
MVDMISPSSVGCRTDLMLIGWDGTIDELDGAIRARSPSNPDFYYGSFLLFPDAPRPGDAGTWIARCEAAFRDDARIRHVCLRWDRPDGARGAADELAAEGLTVEETIVLETCAPHPPPKLATNVELRMLTSDADWDAVEALQVATMTEQHGSGGGAFARNQVARYRRFVRDGRGAWFGAFSDGTLAADMGVFVERGLARFQAVETAAAFRRRGLCGTLAHHAARVAMTDLGAERLVIVGVPDHTTEIYRSVGFEVREHLVAALGRRR